MARGRVHCGRLAARDAASSRVLPSLRLKATFEARHQLLLVEIFANEYEPVLAWLIAPWLKHFTSEEHMDTLIHILLVTPRHRQHALHAVDVRPLPLQERVRLHAEEDVEVARRPTSGRVYTKDTNE